MSRLVPLKFIAIGGTVLLIVIFMLTKHIGKLDDKIAEQRGQMSQIEAVVEAPSDKFEVVLLATRTLKAERDSFSAQLDRNSARVRDAKAAADEADAALKAEQEANRQRFRQSEKRIEELSKRRAAPNDEAALSIIREDSKAPWDGWK